MKFTFNLPAYRLQKLLASDRFCHYFQAIQLNDAQTVLIQVFNVNFQANQSFRNQFDNYSRFLSGKDLGVITPVFETGWSDGCAYVVSGFFPLHAEPGAELPRLPLQHVLAAGIRIASTLTRLHKRNLVYAGLEPRNLLFSKQARIALAPIPLQRTLPVLRKPALAVLQPEQRLYLAPESGQELSAASDFYALGVVLYQMMFNRSPFSHTEMALLQREKESLEKAPVSNDFAFMSDFFRRLLHADPVQRINNVTDFRQALEDSGIGLENGRITLPLKPFSEPGKIADRSRPLPPPAPSSSKPRALMMAMVLSAVAGGSWFYMQHKKPPERAATAPIPIETQPVMQAQPIDQPTARDEAERYYLLALKQFNEGGYAEALLTVNNALREYPEHVEALQLKQHAIREIELLPLFRAAQRQLQAQRLMWPPGDNALESYRAIAARLEPGDHRAEQGFSEIADRFHEQASADLARADFTGAMENVANGLAVVPGHVALGNLRENIQLRMHALELDAQRERLLAQQKQQEIARREQEFQQQRAEQEQKRQQFERILRAREERERQLEQQRLQHIERQRLVEANRYNVNRLLSSVRSYLVGSKPTLESLKAASGDYAEAMALADPADDRLPLFKRDLINAFLNLAQRLKGEALYPQAREAVELGLSLNENDLDLVVLKNELDRLQGREAGR